MKLTFGFWHGEGDNRIDHDPLPEIKAESARGCALVAASIVDARILAAIKRQFVQDPDRLNALFQESGPLGSFGARVNLARVMNVITEIVAKETQIIVRIRNIFAHRFTCDSFDDQQVKSLCMNLQIPDIVYRQETPEIRKMIDEWDPNEMSPFFPDNPFGTTFFGPNIAENLKDARSRYVGSTMLIAGALARPLPRPLPYV